MTLRLTRGQHLLIDGISHNVQKRTSDGRIVLERESDQMPIVKSDSDIADGWAAGSIIFEYAKSRETANHPRRDIRACSKNERREAVRRSAYMKALDQLTPPHSDALLRDVSARVARTLEDPLPPSPATMRRWRRRWINGGRADITLMIPNIASRGNRVPRFSQAVSDILEELVETRFMVPHKASAKRLYADLESAIQKANISQDDNAQLFGPKSVKTVERYIRRIDPYEAAKAHVGRIEADRRFRSVKRGPQGDYALEVVEIDHTLLDLFCYISRKGRRYPVGRCWLTIVLDRYSRLVCGYYLGFEPASAARVGAALRNAILPKTSILERLKLPGQWPAHGIPSVVVADNGAEFHGKALEESCKHLGMSLIYAPAFAPQFKGKVERFFGTLSRDLLHPIAGSTGGKRLYPGQKAPKKLAQVSFDELERLIVQWILNYHETHHRGMGETPKARWERSCQSWPVTLPQSPIQLAALAGDIEKRVLQHYGIEYNGLRYNSRDLERFRRQGGSKQIEFLVDRADLGCIFVVDRDGDQIIEVPTVDEDVACGLSAYELECIKKWIRQNGNGRSISVGDLRSAREQMRAAYQELLAKPGTTFGVKLARALNLDGETVSGSIALAREWLSEEVAPDDSADEPDNDFVSQVMESGSDISSEIVAYEITDLTQGARPSKGGRNE